MMPRSLAARVTLLCALIAVAMTGMLGGWFFFTAQRAIHANADEQLASRAEHFRRLVAETGELADLRRQATLLEDLIGTAGDVLVLRRAGGVLVAINPDGLRLPASLSSTPADLQASPRDVHETHDADRPPVRWVSAMAKPKEGSSVEVLAGHPMSAEMRMLGGVRDQALRSTLMSIAVSALLVWLVLRHGLKPLHRIAGQAARIAPMSLGVRLDEHDAPRELQEMVAVFNAMLDRIAGGYERLSQFSADLAHEIRTPVGALIGQTQVALARSRSEAEYRELLESNLEELDWLRRIVDDMLFLARADHAALAGERQRVSLADELQGIADYFEGPAEEAGLRLAVQAGGTALVNIALCRRAVHNLVANALRHATPGTAVRLVGTQDDAGSLIAVENDGLPVPAEPLARLFDRFFRADAARARPAESNGLGLAIVKAIVTLHGGEAGVTCTPGGTIRFELRFPRA